jgi:hypothetical protein
VRADGHVFPTDGILNFDIQSAPLFQSLLPTKFCCIDKIGNHAGSGGNPGDRGGRDGCNCHDG